MNPWKHGGVNKLMKDRIKKLPIYTVDSDIPIYYEGTHKNYVKGKNAPNFDKFVTEHSIKSGKEKITNKEYNEKYENKYKGYFEKSSVSSNLGDEYIRLGQEQFSKYFYDKNKKQFYKFSEGIEKNGHKHITDKDTNRKLKKDFYNSIKKTPHLLTDIEESKTQIFIRPESDFEKYGVKSDAFFNSGKDDKGNQIIKDKIVTQSFKNEREIGTKMHPLFHELKHQKQAAIPGYSRVKEIKKQEGQLWTEMKAEQEAEDYDLEQMQKVSKYPKTLKKIYEERYAETDLRLREPYLTKEEIKLSNMEKSEQLKKEAKVEEEEFIKEKEEEALSGYRKIFGNNDNDDIMNVTDYNVDNPDKLLEEYDVDNPDKLLEEYDVDNPEE